ncbi:Pentatricopeptide repeat-containing protein [Sesamum alatum]|uniref:Pentatricopeptide repeat-containing protein n=1 Tax=Sesamum alatum TaxID=300844 RepID=A0AAE2CPB6_9LAMI|nr:Pentatricopeptide repeat-containing protein [Sesamum alatum]
MSGRHLDPVAVIIGLGACSHICALKLGKEIHGLAIRNSSIDYDNVKNALITLYCRCGDLMHAYIVFTLIEAKNIISWNSIISGFSRWDRSEEATFLFRELLLAGIEPNYVTLAGILPLCARVANLQHGKEFHCYIARREEFQGPPGTSKKIWNDTENLPASCYWIRHYLIKSGDHSGSAMKMG